MGDQGEDDRFVRFEREGGALVATLVNRTRRNAFTPEMRTALADAIDAAGSDATVRAIIIRGEGEHFCAGADISRIPPTQDMTTIAFRERMKDTVRFIRSIASSPKPVIASIEGIAVGGGLALAMACDIVVAAESAKLSSAFAKLGLLPELGSLYTVTQRVGRNRAKRMMLLSEAFSGAQAVREGLADLEAAPGEAFAVALEMARAFEGAAPLATAATKAAFSRPIDTLEEAIQIETDLVPELSKSADFQEGLAAFREKRAPDFKGR